ncbi:unnamed protein product [Hymenolepis diminuta]|uniref:PDZ domain-containing protein n=1 Tax=Hymenolepis diminuta TaxID=6216 RepID=A0A0R3SU83_HYMDI|nr:unnamed protein product [Hymenolepis diminuta]VUZ42302.1 unnamed protein product [Hymenolepis diminuta]
MCNSEIAQKSSTSNSASTSITSENLSTEPSFMWSLTYDGENSSSTDVNQLPQYSWRKKVPNKCNGSDSQRNTPSPVTVDKENMNSRELLKSKYEILQQIALEHSKLVGFMQDELDLTGVEAEDYSESMKAYEKAVDDFECFQIFMDSMVITAGQEPDVNPEVEKQISHRETSYALSPRMLRKITYGSLQNIFRTQEQERKGVVEVIDITGDSDSLNQDQLRNRASSTPREVFPPTIPRSATISVGSTSIISKARLLGNKETPEKTPVSIPLVSAPALQRFFSLKSLSESLPMLISRPTLGIARRSIDVNGGVGSGDVLPPPPAQPRRAVTRIDPKRLDELITWKNMEIATVQNILKANLEKAKDSDICKKSRRAYRDSAQENQKTLLQLYRENEELKEARQSALASRSQSVGRFEKSSTHPQLPTAVYCVPPSPLPQFSEIYQNPLLNHHQNHSLSIGGDGISDTSSFHADEQSTDSSNSSTKHAHHSALTISCQSSGLTRAYNSVSTFRKDISSDNRSQNPPSSSIEYVQSLFPYQINQQGMRSYGRPNYSRHGSVSFKKANRPEDLSKLPRFYPIQDSHFNSVYGYSGYHSPKLFQSNPHHRLVQYTNFSTTNYFSQTPSRTSPTHFNPKSNNFPQDVQVISKLDQFISPPANQQLTSPEVTPTPKGSRVRFTLADKLNMCTMNPTTTSNSSY